MKRKVIEISPHTFALTLPAEYVKLFNISKGDSLEVTQIDHSLIVSKQEPLTFSFDKKSWMSYSTRFKIRAVKYLLQNGYDRVLIPYDDISDFFLRQIRIWRIYEVNNKLVIENLEKNATRNVLSALNYLILVLKELLGFNMDFKLLMKTSDLLSKVSFRDTMQDSNHDFGKFFTLVNIMNSLKRLTQYLTDNSEYFFMSDVINDMIRILSLDRTFILGKISLDKFLLFSANLVDKAHEKLKSKPYYVVNLKSFQFESITDVRVKNFHRNLVSLLDILP